VAVNFPSTWKAHVAARQRHESALLTFQVLPLLDEKRWRKQGRSPFVWLPEPPTPSAGGPPYTPRCCSGIGSLVNLLSQLHSLLAERGAEGRGREGLF